MEDQRCYLVFSHMLNSFDREEFVNPLWELVKLSMINKARGGYERVLWGDLKTMFDLCKKIKYGGINRNYSERIAGIKRLLDDLEVTTAKIHSSGINKDGIFISQDKYVEEILKKYGFTDVKTASTQMETQKPLLKDENGEEVVMYSYV
ncbi:hypothetical protein Tco_0716266 [Tanacetum coccineum]